MGSDMNKKWIIAIAWLVSSAAANAEPDTKISRGELLYSTHCIACHSAEIHWRDKQLATDWISLNAQVRRWQEIAGLGWREDDVASVAHYLNAIYYHYPE
jgi:mono/diheme cytochrome c family protein